MKQELVAMIKRLLNEEVESTKERMINYIHRGLPPSACKELVQKYQEAYIAREDFQLWLYEQEEEDEN